MPNPAPDLVEKMTMTDTNAPARSGFAAFELGSALDRAIKDLGFKEPRPIQSEAIPAALEGRDILGLAQTGTGKTAAFALPLLDLILEEPCKGPLALVVAPTRELATQIDKEIKLLAKYTKVKTLTIFGGVSMGAQIQGLRRHPDIIVACPGRLLDLHGQGFVDFSRIEALVLDEADHMFDMGFLPSILNILELLPKERQNLMFSATMPPEIRRLADRILSEPHVVELADSRPAETIQHALYPVQNNRKVDLLHKLLELKDCKSAIVFTRTKHRAKSLAMQLSKAGHNAIAIQGNMSQSQRDHAMQGFRKGKYEVLVATDIVARGIDVSGVSYVINYDAPNTPEAYTHRIGRTGRAEQSGRACTLVSNEDGEWIRATERYLGGPIDRVQVPGFEGVLIRGMAEQEAEPLRGKRGKRKPYGRRGRARRKS